MYTNHTCGTHTYYMYTYMNENKSLKNAKNLYYPVIEVGQGSDFGKVKLSADICFVSIINITSQ